MDVKKKIAEAVEKMTDTDLEKIRERVEKQAIRLFLLLILAKSLELEEEEQTK